MANDAQIDFWNGPSGQKWADQATALDGLLAPFSTKVLEASSIQSGTSVLDIGCGAGAMTLRAADSQFGGVSALGVDVSEPLIKLARQRAKHSNSKAEFELADASTFNANKKFDSVISRFGVMFFEDPVSAFKNIHALTNTGGRLTFVCWQAVTLNEWLIGPIQAALPFLKQAPTASGPEAPGPFSFADLDIVRNHLGGAGWQNISIDPLQAELTLPGQSLASTTDMMLQFGPLAGMISEQDIDPEPVHEAVTQRLSSNVGADGRVRMGSACWIVQARA